MAAPHISPDLIDIKRAARQRALAVRAGYDPALGHRLGEHLLRQCPPPPQAIVAGFLPMAGEIDVLPLLQTLFERGNPIALPVTPKRGNPLTFRLWQPGDPLIPEPFGTQRPTGDPAVPGYLLVPLLAFDRRGYRLGYGGGFYDRTLAGLPNATAIGCAFAAQELDEVPTGPYDFPLTAIATEHGLILPPKPRSEP
jgi:5-formyltetrahydrofolate cyclo-ligase